MNDYQFFLNAKEYLIIYLRKSRADNEFESIEEVLLKHETQLQEFAIRLTGSKIQEENIYREVVSGETIEDRPKVKELLSRMQDPYCKGVLVIEPQRLTRGDLIDLGNIISAFRFSKTLVLTPNKTFDLDNKYDREFFERELLRGKDYVEYTKEILARGKEQSVKSGNFVSSTPPFGYKRVKLGKDWTLEIVAEEADVVRMMFDLYVNKGHGATRISHTVNELGFRTRTGKLFRETAIRTILQNEAYIGKVRWNANPQIKVFEDGRIKKKRIRTKDYDVYEGKHAPIISDELFHAAQERKGNVTKEPTSKELTNVLAGLLKCGKCGGAITHRIHRRGEKFYRAPRYFCRSSIYCNNMSINSAPVVSAVVEALKTHLQDFQIELDNGSDRTIEVYETLLRTYENELEQLEERQNTLYDLLEKGLYTKDVFLERNEKLAKEREDLFSKIQTAKLNKPTVEENQQKYFSLFEAINSLENNHISAKAKNMLLKNIVEKISYVRTVKTRYNEDPIFELEVVLK